VRREKGEGRKEKGERRREKGEGRKEKGERRREKGAESPFAVHPASFDVPSYTSGTGRPGPAELHPVADSR
jgi:hypothetical protein